MEWLEALFTWKNFLYFLIIVLGAFLTVVSAKYRNLVKEIKEAAETVSRAIDEKSPGGKEITKEEYEKIMKEILDIFAALLRLVWRPFRVGIK